MCGGWGGVGDGWGGWGGWDGVGGGWGRVGDGWGGGGTGHCLIIATDTTPEPVAMQDKINVNHKVRSEMIG